MKSCIHFTRDSYRIRLVAIGAAALIGPGNLSVSAAAGRSAAKHPPGRMAAAAPTAAVFASVVKFSEAQERVNKSDAAVDEKRRIVHLRMAAAAHGATRRAELHQGLAWETTRDIRIEEAAKWRAFAKNARAVAVESRILEQLLARDHHGQAATQSKFTDHLVRLVRSATAIAELAPGAVYEPMPGTACRAGKSALDEASHLIGIAARENTTRLHSGRVMRTAGTGPASPAAVARFLDSLRHRIRHATALVAKVHRERLALKPVHVENTISSLVQQSTPKAGHGRRGAAGNKAGARSSVPRKQAAVTPQNQYHLPATTREAIQQLHRFLGTNLHATDELIKHLNMGTFMAAARSDKMETGAYARELLSQYQDLALNGDSAKAWNRGDKLGMLTRHYVAIKLILDNRQYAPPANMALASKLYAMQSVADERTNMEAALLKARVREAGFPAGSGTLQTSLQNLQAAQQAEQSSFAWWLHRSGVSKIAVMRGALAIAAAVGPATFASTARNVIATDPRAAAQILPQVPGITGARIAALHQQASFLSSMNPLPGVIPGASASRDARPARTLLVVSGIATASIPGPVAGDRLN